MFGYRLDFEGNFEGLPNQICITAWLCPVLTLTCLSHGPVQC